MFNVYYLGADDNTPLTKTITPTEISAYPNVKHFNSFEYTLPDPSPDNTDCITTFHQTLLAHADLGHGLVKGQLAEPLRSAPRRGKIDRYTPTQWLWLDIDGLTGINTVDQFIQEVLPAQFHGVDHIIHHSASSGLKAGLRAHILFLLSEPTAPAAIKDWIIALNLVNPLLRSGVALAESGLALTYPLDVTTCENSKVLYISPPRLVDLVDPFAGRSRIDLVIQGARTVPGALTTSGDVRGLTHTVINDLRAERGLRRRSEIKSKEFNGTTYAQSPEIARITGILEDGEYTRLNLGDGERYSYWHFTDNPYFLYNFKGEPVYRLEDIVPEYWREVRQKRAEEIKSESYEHEAIPFVFREFNEDKYYNAIFYPKENDLKIAQAGSKDRLSDFMAINNRPMPENVEDWAYEFEPGHTVLVDPKRRFVNRFRPSTYLKNAAPRPEIQLPTHCPIIHRILTSVCASEEAETYFINWLAYIVQTRQKPQTAWVFHGTTGTGKGLLFHNILSPMFGERHAMILTLNVAKEKFNAWIQDSLIVLVDEVNAVGKEDRAAINTLKNAVTERNMGLRKMNTNMRRVPTYFGMIFASNEIDAMNISADDRRFFIANRQERRLQINEDDIKQIPNELQHFTDMLMAMQIDESMVKTPFMSEAKIEMQDAGTSSTDSFWRCLREGNLDPILMDAADQPVIERANLRIMTRQLLDEIIPNATLVENISHPLNPDSPFFALTSPQMQTLYDDLQNNRQPLSPHAFGRMLARNGLRVKPTRIDERVVRARRIQFRYTQEALDIYEQGNPNATSGAVVPFPSQRRGLPNLD